MDLRWKYFLGLLALTATTTWLAVLVYPEPKLHLIACDVGQGDAILAIHGTTQVLVDGGPNNQVLDCLADNLPFWDREIEVVVLTHPQTDHFKGLIEVFRRYDVKVFIATPLDSSTPEYKVLKSVVGGSGAKVVNPTTGMVIRSGLLYLDMLYPNAEVLSVEPAETGEGVLGAFTSNRDPNDFSVVAVLRLGEFDALLTGDIRPGVIDEVLATGLVGDVEYIKIPHHGSKNGLTRELLDVSTPEVAVISVGAKNHYGHPHEEILKILSERDIRMLRTDKDGEIEVVTDGKSWWIE